MSAEDLLQKLLDIAPPWKIVRLREDLGKNQIDLWVAQQTGKSWFFGAKTTAIREEREQVWRHVNLGGSRCVIHAEVVAGDASFPWVGDKGQPFTHAMAQQVVAMMRDGVKLQSICSLLDVTVGDLWKFKHGLDNGEIGLANSAAAVASTTAASISRIPEADASIWSGLLDGSITIEIRLLSLKLLLTKMREQMRLITDPEVRALKCFELQRFFVRYEKNLGHELSQLAKHL